MPRARETLILSSEEFSRLAPEQVDMQALRAYAAPFRACRIVFVLRNQLSYIQSLYLEMQRQFRLPGVDAYVKQCLASGHASGMFLDYGALYDHALTAFAADEVRLLSYETLITAGPDLTRTFLDALGLRPAALELEAAGRSNVSPSPLASWAANRVSSPEIASPRLVELATRAFAEEFGEDAGSMLFTPAEAEAIRPAFRADEPGDRGALPRDRPGLHPGADRAAPRRRPPRPDRRLLLAAARAPAACGPAAIDPATGPAMTPPQQSRHTAPGAAGSRRAGPCRDGMPPVREQDLPAGRPAR